MSRLSIGNPVLVAAAGLFLVSLACAQSNAEARPPGPTRSTSNDCIKSDILVHGTCPGAGSLIAITYRSNYPRQANVRKAKAFCPHFAKSVPYATARARLIQSGWHPGEPRNPDACEKGDGRCEGRPEMQSCAGTAEANCQFLWQKTGTLIVVSTKADPPVVDGVTCPYKLPPDPR